MALNQNPASPGARRNGGRLVQVARRALSNKPKRPPQPVLTAPLSREERQSQHANQAALRRWEKARALCVAAFGDHRGTRLSVNMLQHPNRAPNQGGTVMTLQEHFEPGRANGQQAVGKTETEYKMTVIRLLVQMREKGEIPFDWIADHTRATYGPNAYGSLAECLRATAKKYRRRVWDDAQCQVFVFCEKDALAAVLGQETDPYDVPLCVARGYSSISYLNEIAKAIAGAGKAAYIYHFGDHDPSGQDAARDTEEKLRRYAPGATIHFERVAVTLKQIEDWNLPGRPTKTKDTRAKKFGRDTSVELDAIPVDKLRALVRSHIKLHVDKKRLKRLRIDEKRERKLLRKLAAEYAEAAI